MLRPALLLIIGLSLSLTTLGQGGSQSPKYSNSFLNIGVGGANMGMGGASVASTKDVNAIYWNPAGLVRDIQKTELALMHSEYFIGIGNYDYGAIAHRLDHNNSLGLAVVRMAIDDIPNTLNLVDANGNVDYNRISSFSATDLAIIMSYARYMSKFDIRVGGNAKIIRRTLGQFGGAWGFGFDLGLQKDVGEWTFGLNIRDLTNTFNFWSFNEELFEDAFAATGNIIPESSLELTRPSFALGAARIWSFKEDKLKLLAEADLDLYTDGKRNSLISTNAVSGDVKLGAEISYIDRFYFRAGLNNFQRGTDLDNTPTSSFQPNLGAGVRIRNLMIDYSITDLGNSDNAFYSNVISLLIQFRD